MIRLTAGDASRAGNTFVRALTIRSPERPATSFIICGTRTSASSSRSGVTDGAYSTDSAIASSATSPSVASITVSVASNASSPVSFTVSATGSAVRSVAKIFSKSDSASAPNFCLEVSFSLPSAAS